MEETPMGESIKISCERCRRRKIKCDRKRPCSRCVKAGTECILSGSGEKQRPISKGYVQALEGQVASLELLIRKLAVADSAERDDMLSEIALSPPASLDMSQKPTTDHAKSNADPKVVAAQVRSGQLRRPRSSHATQFFGGTSAFHIHLSQEVSLSPDDLSPQIESNATPVMMTGGMAEMSSNSSPRETNFVYAPHDETSQACMAAYFQYQYQFHLLIYREYFLRDYDVGSGRYYSDALLFAICSLGAMQLDDFRSVSDIFAHQAQQLIYADLDSPELTTLQALALLGYREIGAGHTSKGWLFAGMAFRLAHEMGLHLDPNNWDASSEGASNRDTEILRRVYWAIFIADKQLSLYFGRPPALHPSESDVRNTIRLQYPPDWEGLLDTYICKGASATEFEDGVALVGAFIYQAELCKIAHLMITDLFENRRGNVDATVAATRSRQIHVSLTKWLSSLPGTLHWNQWTVGIVQPSVLRMHMFFHTIMIILHRPPSHLYEKPGIAESEDVEICYESLQAILRLMRTYSRHYRFRSLPLDFVQTLSTAAGTIMMKRFFQVASWEDSDIARSLSTVIEAMEEVQHTWPCMSEIKDYVVRARNAQVVMPPEDPLIGPDLMNGLELDHNVTAELMAQWGEELGTLVTDEFLSMQLQGSEQGVMAPFDFNQLPLGPR
ncbi:fungal-specific transcription factor domain-containing protein [Fusarium flagelliforme]|uniref:fungal-specific transcription factor domain-containing protein n=1 Tax=Fusarium flagelliforme TaxID=2675880 RepID=UPI001E8D87CE|nr:fungal-specific transcription factor domain-containing protein [Fusarium flagelliforme]KAH7188671.1 fungal-specific transcription factor domain-containing protein [Fusarium flagelliforme]